MKEYETRNFNLFIFHFDFVSFCFFNKKLKRSNIEWKKYREFEKANHLTLEEIDELLEKIWSFNESTKNKFISEKLVDLYYETTNKRNKLLRLKF